MSEQRITLSSFLIYLNLMRIKENNWEVKSIYNRIELGGIHLKSSHWTWLPEALFFWCYQHGFLPSRFFLYGTFLFIYLDSATSLAHPNGPVPYIIFKIVYFTFLLEDM